MFYKTVKNDIRNYNNGIDDIEDDNGGDDDHNDKDANVIDCVSVT